MKKLFEKTKQVIKSNPFSSALAGFLALCVLEVVVLKLLFTPSEVLSFIGMIPLACCF
jgi:hypothetical protein